MFNYAVTSMFFSRVVIFWFYTFVAPANLAKRDYTAKARCVQNRSPRNAPNFAAVKNPDGKRAVRRILYIFERGFHARNRTPTMLQTSRAVILRTIKYSDSAFIADAYTETDGRRSFMVRIPKTARARVKNVLFAPMALLRMEWNDRNSPQLQRVRDVQPANIYSSIPYSPAKTAIAMFLSEFLSATLRAPFADKRVFDFVFTSLQWLDEEEANCANFHIVFMLHLASFLGLAPNMENYAEDRWFDMENGCFTMLRPAGNDVVQPDEARYLPMLMRLKYTTAARMRFTREQRAQMLQELLHYYSVHLPSFPQMKSPDILREVFG